MKTAVSDRVSEDNAPPAGGSLTAAQLRVPDPPRPRNPLVEEPLFLGRHIEHAGTLGGSGE